MHLDSVLQSIQSTKLETIGQSVTKTCKVCKETKDISQFGRNGTWHRPDCLSCNAKMQRDYLKIRKKHKTPPLGTPCECCGKTSEKLHWDHCHDSSEHRGWLCNNCNTGIGKLGDNIEGVLKAVDYLAKVNKLGTHQGGTDDLAAA
jgi:hypothetical protein